MKGIASKGTGYHRRQKKRSVCLSLYFRIVHEDDRTDTKVWKQENHSLGIAVGMDKVRAVFLSARQDRRRRTASVSFGSTGKSSGFSARQ